MPVQSYLRILKKLEPPVDQRAAAGDVALAHASAPETPTNPSTAQTMEKPTEKTQNPPNPEKISTTPEVSQNTPLNFGYLDMRMTPETKEPPAVIGNINGKSARILLDSGCSTYVLSEEFAVHADICQYSTTPVPIELAVRNASHPTLETQTKTADVDQAAQDEKGLLYSAFTPV